MDPGECGVAGILNLSDVRGGGDLGQIFTCIHIVSMVFIDC